MVETPILYITFARPEYANKSFTAIKKAKPKKLYFYSNKARDNKIDEVSRNNEVRSYVKQIDWDCQLETWFREEYVDVFTSIKGAIDWLFENEEKGIVIEEDVVPSLSFFEYVDRTIDRYRATKDIWIVSGNNAVPECFPKGYSCCLTRWADIYGWASWREVWCSVDWKMSQWPKYKQSRDMRRYWGSWPMYFFMKQFYKKFYKAITSSDYAPWDSIFLFSMRFNNGYCLTPFTNLCQDIGSVGANHNQGESSSLSELGPGSENVEVFDRPALLQPSIFDKKLFYKHVLPGVVRRKIRKYLHI